jgi:hypothetical protein
MLRRLLTLSLLLGSPVATHAQAQLVPSARAPYSTKFDLAVPDAQFHLVPVTRLDAGEGPFSFRFRDGALQDVLDHPATLRYLVPREGGFHLQVLHLRPAEIPATSLGPQPFEVRGPDGTVVGAGTILVTARLPEALDVLTDDPTRTLEVGREARVRLRIRSHGNLRGAVRVVNSRDFDLLELEEESAGTAGVRVVSGVVRPLRSGATELRLAVETLDGRDAELAFGGLTVREPEPYRVLVTGGPILLDAVGRGTATVTIRGLPTSAGEPRVGMTDPSGELRVEPQRFDRGTGELTARLVFRARSTRPAGSREVRDLSVRVAMQEFRGQVEVLGLPVVSSVQTENTARATLFAGAPGALVRVSGANLDGVRIDCAPLGPGAVCETVDSGPVEWVGRVAVGWEAREGEAVLPLIRGGGEPGTNGAPVGSIRVQVERGSIPVTLTQPSLLTLNCAVLPSCRVGGREETLRIAAADLPRLQLALDDARLPAEAGWQRLVITVTRVRGEQRQTLRSFGTPTAPRTYRAGFGMGALSLFDASADPRHGDQFVIRVEHAAEQYGAEYRGSGAANEPFVRRVYVDGGLARRLTADASVQPVLFRPGVGGEERSVQVLYPNAGVGLTWHFLNEQLEPRLFSIKFQFLATDIKNAAPGGTAAQPALLLSGNLRVPGTDPTKPLALMGGLARMFGDDGGWRFLAGAGIDLGVARLLFGG